jgi:hypothetical protein
MWDTFACATANFISHFIISIAVLENVPPDAGLQKRATFSTLNVGLAGMGGIHQMFLQFFYDYSFYNSSPSQSGCTKLFQTRKNCRRIVEELYKDFAGARGGEELWKN